MRITLIKPNIGKMEHSLYVDEARMEPLQLGVIAALTPEELELEMYDDRMEAIPYDRQTDLVAVTVETFTARRAYEIAGEFRKRGVRVILGGMHVRLMPEEASEHADSIFIGDAEKLWHAVIDDVKKGKLNKVYAGGIGIPHPGVYTRRDIFKGKGYLPITLTQFSRGCRYNCSFCVTSVYFNRTHCFRDVKEVIGEIESQERNLIFFVDDNIVANPDAAKKLFRELIPLNVKWVSQASIDMTQDKELMDLMVKSGCLGHVVGFESIDVKNLKWMNKTPNLNLFDGYDRQLKILRDHGLQLWAAFTLGHDFDTLDSIKRTLEFAVNNKFCFAAFNILMPYPQTPLYEKLKEENRLLYDGKWWLHPEYRFNYAAYEPKNMSADELTEACFEARKIFNSPASIIKRAFDFKTNMSSLYRLAIYASYNPLFRKEVFKKQGMIFGLNNMEQEK
ncbi:Radical SAM superfamily enzyme YgiQ, UPF0313 family [Peptoclostridium litorale DSM 5388]|uniref:Methyltransferase n=1 Tax=Peptoclostridium litorale DSM 5388 TaxID=1121324 RepID=A0A069RKI9_PEPLI|nr:radical SAM protein [Peptoclostridium litorale]KDR96620.1 methyltransferase [Peptoclostridium litorale DSM 5388]SIN68381.1 Radical SAM superfamily enzyme YgiQ, UPF0313 family [Peptoclostridium litorale DSM 5388]